MKFLICGWKLQLPALVISVTDVTELSPKWCQMFSEAMKKVSYDFVNSNISNQVESLKLFISKGSLRSQVAFTLNLF